MAIQERGEICEGPNGNNVALTIATVALPRVLWLMPTKGARSSQFQSFVLDGTLAFY